jgi:O-antigen/teichoic acid export membrane protein
MTRALSALVALRGKPALIDQIISGCSNFLAILIVARHLSAPDFGRFAVIYGFALFALALSRAFFAPMVTLTANAATTKESTGALATVVFVLGMLAGVLVACTAIVVSPQSIAPAIAVGCGLPIICTQDFLRFAAVNGGHPRVALFSDLVWLLLMVVILLLPWSQSPVYVLSAWTLAAVAALVGAVVGMSPYTRWALPRLRLLGLPNPVGRHELVGVGLVSSSTLVLITVVASVLGPAAAGALRGASALMAPINVLFAFGYLSLASSQYRRERGSDLSFVRRYVAIIVGAVTVWVSLLHYLPLSLGTTLYGETWTGAHSIILITGAEYVGLTLLTAGTLTLTVNSLARQLLITRTLLSVTSLLFGLLLMLEFGSVRSVSVALAIAAFISAIVAFGLYMVRRPQRVAVLDRPWSRFNTAWLFPEVKPDAQGLCKLAQKVYAEGLPSFLVQRSGTTSDQAVISPKGDSLNARISEALRHTTGDLAVRLYVDDPGLFVVVNHLLGGPIRNSRVFAVVAKEAGIGEDVSVYAELRATPSPVKLASVFLRYTRCRWAILREAWKHVLGRKRLERGLRQPVAQDAPRRAHFSRFVADSVAGSQGVSTAGLLSVLLDQFRQAGLLHEPVMVYIVTDLRRYSPSLRRHGGNLVGVIGLEWDADKEEAYDVVSRRIRRQLACAAPLLGTTLASIAAWIPRGSGKWSGSNPPVTRQVSPSVTLSWSRDDLVPNSSKPTGLALFQEVAANSMNIRVYRDISGWMVNCNFDQTYFAYDKVREAIESTSTISLDVSSFLK